SVAMWDAWAAYDPVALSYLVREKHAVTQIDAARAKAISYAAYRLLKYRFPVGSLADNGNPCHPNAAVSQAAFDAPMVALGSDPGSPCGAGGWPAWLGKRIVPAVTARGQSDGAKEGRGVCYPDDTGSPPANPPLIFKLPGVGDAIDPNRWQPLAFDFLVTQNG